MRRSLTDYEWRDEVVRRHQRRRYKTQQRDAAIAELRAELEKPLVWLLDRLSRLHP